MTGGTGRKYLGKYLGDDCCGFLSYIYLSPDIVYLMTICLCESSVFYISGRTTDGKVLLVDHTT